MWVGGASSERKHCICSGDIAIEIITPYCTSEAVQCDQSARRVLPSPSMVHSPLCVCACVWEDSSDDVSSEHNHTA